MPISITQAERGLLSATRCLFVLEKAGTQGERALLFGFFSCTASFGCRVSSEE